MAQYVNFKISRITIFVGLFIIISASFTRQVIEFLQALIGGKETTALLGLMMIIACLVFLIFATKKNIHFIKTPLTILVLIMGLILAWQTEYSAEKIHLLEYGVLGWLAANDLLKINRKEIAIILASFFCLDVGILDELFQAVLPYRVCDIRDVVMNSIGGIWGIILYLLTWGR